MMNKTRQTAVLSALAMLLGCPAASRAQVKVVMSGAKAAASDASPKIARLN